MDQIPGVSGSKPRFNRVLLKLSGQALAPSQGSGIDLDALNEIASEVKYPFSPAQL